MWETFLSNYKHFRCQSSSVLSQLEDCKNGHKKGKISISDIKQRKNYKSALFLIQLRQISLNLCVDFGKFDCHTIVFSLSLNSLEQFK